MKLSDLFRKLADEVEDDPGLEKAWDEFTIDVPISKMDPDQRLAFGWANVAFRKDGTLVLDRQGDFVDDVGELEKTAYHYVLESRDAGQDHGRRGVAQLVESMVFTPEKLEKMGLAPDAVPLGWWTGYKVHDDEVWKGVKDGTYPMFSIHGMGRRTPADEVVKTGLKHEHGKGETCPICSRTKMPDKTGDDDSQPMAGGTNTGQGPAITAGKPPSGYAKPKPSTSQGSTGGKPPKKPPTFARPKPKPARPKRPAKSMSRPAKPMSGRPAKPMTRRPRRIS